MVGLDIGSYSVKAVELRARKKGGGEAYDLVKIGYEPLPHDAIVEGTIIDSAAVVETIRLLFEENKISTKDVAISISGNSVIIKKISLPVMEKQELAESHHLGGQAQHPLPLRGDQRRLRHPQALARDRREEPGHPARRRQEGQDRQLQQRHRPGPQEPAEHRGRRLRPPERPGGELPRELRRQDDRPDQHRRQHHQRRHRRAGHAPALPRPVPGRLLLHREHPQGAQHLVRRGREAPQGHPREIDHARPVRHPPVDERPRPPRRDREDLLLLRGLREARAEDRADLPQRRPGQRREHGQRLRDEVPDQDGDPQSLPQHPGRRQEVRRGLLHRHGADLRCRRRLGNPKGGEVTMIRINLLKPETKDKEPVVAAGALRGRHQEGPEPRQPHLPRPRHRSRRPLLLPAEGLHPGERPPGHGPPGEEQAPVRRGEARGSSRPPGNPWTRRSRSSRRSTPSATWRPGSWTSSAAACPSGSG
ncbi:MAG: pilus assembly protein PilM [Desulfomicrobium escambiense]|nr:pilus assembly protein PilM [Desulfomicrobium escambiense]